MKPLGARESTAADVTEPVAQERPLGAGALFALGVNGIVGAGIFLTPPLVAASVPGPLGAAVYPLVALGCLPVALCYAQLARVLPRDGGPALYAAEAFGPRVARAVGSIVWVGALFSAAAITRALAERLSALAPLVHLPRPSDGVVAVALCLLFLLLNLSGVKIAARVWTVLTVLKILPLLAVVLVALPRFGSLSMTGHGTGLALGSSSAPLKVLFALQGFEVVPLLAGQVTGATKVVPRATLASLLFASCLYAALHLACVVAIPDLGASSSALPETAAALGGRLLAALVEAGVMVSIAGIAVAMHATTPRYLVATMSGEPSARGMRLNFVAHAVVIGVLALSSSLDQLVGASSVAVLAQYASTALALLVLALRKRLGLMLRDTWTVPLALLLVLVLLSQARRQELILAFVIGVVAVLLPLGPSKAAADRDVSRS